MNNYTDFADELISKNTKEFKKNVVKKNSVTTTTIKILNEKNQFNKPKGTYISIDFENTYDDSIRKDITISLISSMKKLHKINKNQKILIIGLGNQKIIADSLGPMVADKVVVTNHLFKVIDVDKNINKVCVFTPKVMGQTGLESSDIVNSVNKLFKADLMIVIDALASSSIKRVNKVIQLSDTGIAPGSGVGNYRKEISQTNMKCKVIAIGVATVVNVNNIINEISKKIKLDDEKYNLVLTPKEIDEDIEHLSTIIATSINKYIHNDFESF